jgi:hypothetical protein
MVDGAIFRAFWVLGGAHDDAPRGLFLIRAAPAWSVPESRKG